MAGLEPITGGTVSIDGRVVSDLQPPHRDIATSRHRDIATLRHRDGLPGDARNPHKSLHDNIAFGMRLRKTPEHEFGRRVVNPAKLLHIDHLLDRWPTALPCCRPAS